MVEQVLYTHQVGGSKPSAPTNGAKMLKENLKRVEKGWGYELWINNDEKYCGKLLFFKAGKKCSLHYHKLKHETFYVQSGKFLCTFTNDPNDLGEKVILNAGDVKEIPQGLIHQMEALEDSVLVEFSTQHFDEDSHRLVKGD